MGTHVSLPATPTFFCLRTPFSIYFDSGACVSFQTILCSTTCRNCTQCNVVCVHCLQQQLSTAFNRMAPAYILRLDEHTRVVSAYGTLHLCTETYLSQSTHTTTTNAAFHPQLFHTQERITHMLHILCSLSMVNSSRFYTICRRAHSFLFCDREFHVWKFSAVWEQCSQVRVSVVLTVLIHCVM